MTADRPRYIVACASVVERDGRILMVQEDKAHCRGTWNLPAGGLEPDESLQGCARREAREETGVAVEPTALVGVYRGVSDRTGAPVLNVTFAADPVDGTATVPDDEPIRAVDWVDPVAMADCALRAPYVARAVADWRDGRRLSLGSVADLR